MISQLVQKIQKTKAPICVGLDPMLSYIPSHIVQNAFKEFGETLEGAAEAVWQFNKEIVDSTYDLIPSVKPQIAMYEQFGIEGLKIYARTVEYCKKKGLLVIGDVKRGDIGSTSSAYAVGHLGKVKVGSNVCSGFDTDFITVNPYLGTDGVKPFVDVCREEDRGLFVLVKTSNPSSGEFQDRLIDGRPLYELVAEKVVEWGADCMDGTYSNVGAVVSLRQTLQMGIRSRKNRDGLHARLHRTVLFPHLPARTDRHTGRNRGGRRPGGNDRPFFQQARLLAGQAPGTAGAPRSSKRASSAGTNGRLCSGRPSGHFH